jgi:hypothetical protein
MLVEVIGVRHNHLEPGTAGVMCKTAQDLKNCLGLALSLSVRKKPSADEHSE